jgi:hypothetical protein
LYEVVDKLVDRISISNLDSTAARDVTRDVLRNVTLGAMVTLWCYADRYIRPDNSLPITLAGVADVIGLPVTWLDAFPEKWIKVRDDKLVELPNYLQHNHLVTKGERVQTKAAARQEKYRESLRGRDVTEASQETSPQRSEVVTGPGYPGTGTLTHIPNPDPVPGESARRTRARAAPLGGSASPAAARGKPDSHDQAVDDLYRTGGFASASATTPRSTRSFEEEFAARFGASPDQAHEQREAAKAKAKPDKDQH